MIASLHAVVEFWWSWTTAMSLQLIVIVAIIGVADRLLARRVWPQMLAAMWLVPLVKLIVPPTLSSPVSVARVGWAVLPSDLRTATDPAWRQKAHGALFGIWCAGCAGLSSITVWRYRRLRSELLRDAVRPEPAWIGQLVALTAARLQLRRLPDVRLAHHTSSPVVVGFWRPIVVLRRSLVTGATRSHLEHVLLHEFAHVKRCDPLWNLACFVLQLVYWFHPAVWILRARLATLREICCDQAVLSVLGQTGAATYRRTLLDFARPLIEPDRPGWLGFIHRHSQLVERLEWLARPVSARCFGRTITTAAVVGIMLVSLVPLARPPVRATWTTVDSISDALDDGIVPNWNDLPGCLPRRFVVLGMLAKHERIPGAPELALDTTFYDSQETHP